MRTRRLNRRGKGRVETGLAASWRCARAFTLLEVVLALVIAAGLLVVALHFYQQIARVRGECVQAIHKLSTVRLLLDKISSDLRSTHSMGYFDSGFVGGADFIQFVKAEVPPLGTWSEDVSLTTVPPESDLKRIGYTLVISLDETHETGSLMRWEEPNWPSAAAASSEDAEESSAFGTGAAVDREADLGMESDASDASRMEAGSTVFTDHIQYLHFRYFDGSAWLESWDGLGLPMGVEIQMSTQPWSEQTAGEDEYPPDLFRRVVGLPAHRADYEAPEDLSWLEEPAADGTNDLTAPSPDGEEETLP